MTEEQSEIIEGGPLNPVEIIPAPDADPIPIPDAPPPEPVAAKTDAEKAASEGVDLELYLEMKSRGLRA